jgi:hypothetical protein
LRRKLYFRRESDMLSIIMLAAIHRLIEIQKISICRFLYCSDNLIDDNIYITITHGTDSPDSTIVSTVTQ